MTLLTLVVNALRGSFVVAVSLAVVLTMHRASAAVRRCILLCGLGASIAVLPIASCLPDRPHLRITTPGAAHVVAEALIPGQHGAGIVNPRRASVTSAARVSAQTWVSLVWALGTLVVGARILRSHFLAARLLARTEARAAGARISHEIEVPVVAGLLRPAVLLPASSVRWEKERLEAAMLHELAHVRRRDGLALLVAQAACALYWFQPLVWIGLRRLRRECELAADEDVIRAGMRPTTYAGHLLAVARGMSAPLGGIAMASRPAELARRIQVLVGRESPPPRPTRGRTLTIVAGTMVLLGFVACADARTAAPGAATPTTRAKVRDARLQAIADGEADQVRRELGARRVSIVVVEPQSGEVLALSDDSPGEPVVPASTLKPLTVATALDRDVITSNQRFDCGNGERAYGEKVLRDAGRYGLLDAGEILAVSSNIGISRIFDALGGERLGDGLQRFRVDAPAAIPSSSFRGAIIAMGVGTPTTPVALATAYAVFANDGVYPGGGERVIKSATARAMREMLEGVVAGEHATGKAARVAGVRVGGKTGTSEDEECESCAPTKGLFASFVGLVPVDPPRYVIYVGIGQPRDGGTGGSVAAPVFARVAKRALATGG